MSEPIKHTVVIVLMLLVTARVVAAEAPDTASKQPEEGIYKTSTRPHNAIGAQAASSSPSVLVPYSKLRSPAAFDELMDRIWRIEDDIDQPSRMTLVLGMLGAVGGSSEINVHPLAGMATGIRISWYRASVQGIERYIDRVQIVKERQLQRLKAMIANEYAESRKRVEVLKGWQAKGREEIAALGKPAEGTPEDKQIDALQNQDRELTRELAMEEATQTVLKELSDNADVAVRNATTFLDGLAERRWSPYFEALVGYTFHVGKGIGNELGGPVIGGGFGIHAWGTGLSLGMFLGSQGVWGGYASTTADVLK